MTADLDSVVARAHEGKPLTPDDLAAVVESDDLIGLGALADARRRQRHADRVTFVRVCELPWDALVQASQPPVVPTGAGEVRVRGSAVDVAGAVAAVRMAARAAGGRPVTGFELGELARLGEDEAALAHLLTELRAAGLTAIAEARVDASDLARWLSVCADAGCPVTRLTVGSVPSDDGLGLIRRVAELETAGAGVRAFAPLPQESSGAPTTGYGDVRQVALARLLVDNIESIQVDWARYGPKLAQVALTFGADDLDAVSAVDSTDQGWRRAPLEEIRRNIRAAGLRPVERDGRFEPRPAE